MDPERLTRFNELRPLLFSVAYRMSGGVMDAEDILQEAYLRWERASDTEIRDAKAFLTAVVTRLCIDQLRAAHSQRETYIGPWLPEPLLMDETKNPADAAELADSLSFAFLMLLETLSPVERAVFLLREVFGYEYAEIPPDFTFEVGTANGYPAIIAASAGKPYLVMAFELDADKISNIYTVRNPDKLRHLER